MGWFAPAFSIPQFFPSARTIFVFLLNERSPPRFQGGDSFFFYFFLFPAFQENRLDIDRSPGRHIVLLILVGVLAENVSCPGFCVILVCFIFHRHVTRDPFSVHPDAGGGGKKGVRGFRQFCGPDLAIGTKQAVTAAAIQAPWVGAGDFGFAEGVGLNVHFLGVGGWLFGAHL